MLTAMSVTSQRTSVPLLELSIINADSAPIQIRDVQGLGPVKAAVNTAQFGSIDGELYNGSSIGNRNIVLTFGLNPNWAGAQTMSSLRALLYEYFMTKAWTRLTFFSDHMPDVQIDGYVESFEPNMFSKDPEIQVSILCPKPNFVAVTPTTLSGAVVITEAFTVIAYEGTMPTGFVLTLNAIVPYSGGVRVYSEAEGSYEVIDADTPATITATRAYVLSTKSGDKYIRLMTGSTINNDMLASATSEMGWPKLHPGDNDFMVAASPDPGYSAPDSPWYMTYTAEYGGL